MKHYFGADTARKLATQLELPDPEEYAAWVTPRVEDLEISDRVTVFADGLHERLGGDYAGALPGVVDKLEPELAEGEGYFNHAFHLWPVSRWIERHGVEHPTESLDAIEALTRAFTGEWAVRPFLERYPEQTMARVDEWAGSGSHNVRRLASEGIRPRLPWARVHQPFVADPTPILPVLERLHADESRYVRTSVANNLNDIARTHPELAVAASGRWLESGSPHARWVAERGLRGLIKQGDGAALTVLGFFLDDVPPPTPTFPTTVRVGEAATLEVELVNTGAERRELLVDYRLYFLKKNGTRRPTVFRLGRFTLEPGERRAVSKTHAFRVTGTRIYYPGTQAVSVVVNGAESALAEFELLG